MKNRVVADITSPEERNKYLSRVDSCISVAYVIGPAIGGLLAEYNIHFPMYVAGIVSGIAMIVALVFLKESNPKILKQKEIKTKKSKSKEVEAPKEDRVVANSGVESKTKSGKTKAPKSTKAKVQVNLTMILCFIVEFCNKWVISAFDSRYGIYIKDKWQIKSLTYS